MLNNGIVRCSTGSINIRQAQGVIMAKPVLYYDLFNIDSNDIRVDWSMGNKVDFKVHYLHEHFQRGDKDFPTKDTIIEFNKKLQKLTKDSNRGVAYSMVGGEPTCHPYFLEIVEQLWMNGSFITLKTTGVRSKEFWKEAVNYLSMVMLIWHPEWVSVEEVENLIKSMKGRVFLEVYMVPKYFEAIYQKCIELRDEYGINIKQRLVYQDVNKTPYDYTEEQKRKLIEFDPPIKRLIYSNGEIEKLRPNQMALENNKCFTGWKCNIGVSNLVIDMDGNIFKGWCGQNGKIGNIYSENELALDFEPVVCSKTACHNWFDQMATKWDPNIEPEDYLIYRDK
jgi:organic radical activating enzyme